MAVAVLAQAEVEQPPALPPLLGVFSAGCGEFERIESVLGPQGTVEVRYDGQVFRVFPSGAAQAVAWVQPFSTLMPLENRPKWQAGKAWFKSGTRVGCMDPVTRKTMFPFPVDRPFEAFEITGEGDLLLTNTKENWLELYSPGKQDPTFTLAKAPLGTLKVHPGFRWMNLTQLGPWSTTVFGQFVVLMDHNLGRLFSFDTQNQSLSAIEVPWQSPLTLEKPPIAAFRDNHRQYVLNQGIPGANCVQFVPKSSNELAILWRISPVPETGKDEYDSPAWEQMTAIKTGFWEGTVDLQSHRILEVRPVDGLDLPAWYDAAHQRWVGAKTFFGPYLPKKELPLSKKPRVAAPKSSSRPPPFPL